MFSRPGGQDSLLRVLVMRRADGDNLHALVVEHRLIAVVRSAVGESHGLGLGASAQLVPAADGRHTRMRIPLKSANVLRGYPPRTDNSHAEVFFVRHLTSNCGSPISDFRLRIAD